VLDVVWLVLDECWSVSSLRFGVQLISYTENI
jgi:hypothetical protein